MKIISQEDSRYILRFDRGEELLAALAAWCGTNKIGAATLSGIGAAGEIVLAYYNLETKEYENHTITEDLEIISLLGNVALFDARPLIHLHGSFGDKNLQIRGGHVRKLLVSATLELAVQTYAQSIQRRHDATTGLNLLS